MSSARILYLSIPLMLSASCRSDSASHRAPAPSDPSPVNPSSSVSAIDSPASGLESSVPVQVAPEAQGFPPDFSVTVEWRRYLSTEIGTSVTITSDGRVHYEGGSRAKLKGSHDFDTLRPGKVLEIWEAINGLGFFGFRSNYKLVVKDVGPRIITVRADGTTQSVRFHWFSDAHRVGEDLRAHVVLGILADYIEEQVGVEH